MRQTKPVQRNLPDYTDSEEWLHTLSHLIGFCLGVFVLITCFQRTVVLNDRFAVFACIVYGMTFILLYAVSSLYHGLKNQKAKQIMQIIDHCVIYFFIAGTYTPVALISLRQYSQMLGWILFAVVWLMAFVLTALTAVDMKKFKVISMIGYLVLGWCVIAISRQVIAALSASGFLLLLLGGLLYTIGSVLYGLGRKVKYMHALFHLFVLAGSITHFLTIVLFVI